MMIIIYAYIYIIKQGKGEQNTQNTIIYNNVLFVVFRDSM
jgi:hypothetical protein